MNKLLLFALLSLPSVALADIRFLPGIRVTIGAPPPLRYETPPPAPSTRYQWIAGYWAWRGGRQEWIAGHWALPPAPGYFWEPARWETQGGAQVFYDGHWRVMESPDPYVAYQPPPPPVQTVVTEVAPPLPYEETRPPQPFAGATWTPGFWSWSGGHHVWVTGRWSAQPGGYRWEDNRWDKRDDKHWEQHPGHWAHEHDDGDHEWEHGHGRGHEKGGHGEHGEHGEH